MIKRKIFIATVLLASMCMVGGCATSKSGEKAAEATTEAALATEQTTPVELNASEYVKLRSEEHTSELQSHSDLVCRRHTRSLCDWSSDVCSSDLQGDYQS